MICNIEKCQNEIHAKGLCCKHYLQLTRHGKIFNRTRFDKNEIIINGNTVYIILCDNKGNEKERAIIDIEDINKISSFKWTLSVKPKKNHVGKYVCTGRKPKIYLHRLIVNAPKGFVVDHKDGNGLNNCKTNLKICTVSENGLNWFYSRNSYRGVYFHKDSGKWVSELRHNNVRYCIGSFKNEKDAAIAYNNKSIELRGENAKLNIIETE